MVCEGGQQEALWWVKSERSQDAQIKNSCSVIAISNLEYG